MNAPRVYADFHSADKRGHLRLNCVGTLQDLLRQCIVLEEGLDLTLYSEDLETEGRIQFSKDENIWFTVIDWNAIRESAFAGPDDMSLPKSA